MTTITLHSAYFFRGDIIPVTVETTVTDGIGIHVIGIPDAAVKETLLRVITAIDSAGFHCPGKKVVIRITPHGGEEVWAGAFRPRECSEAFDLAIALGILTASGQIARPSWTQYGVDEVLLFSSIGIGGKLQAPYTGIDGTSAAAVLEYQLRRNWSEILGYNAEFFARTLWNSCGDLGEAIDKFTKF